MEGGPPGFGRSFTCSALLGILVGPVGLSAMGLSPAAAQLSSCVRLAFPVPCPSPATPGSKLPGLGSCAFARRYLRNVVLSLLLRVLRCFTSPSVASRDYVFIPGWPPMRAAGLPHSEIRGSTPVDGSPQLIAVFRVLHSLLMPRHPSCARIRLAEFAAARPFAPARRPRLPSA